MPIKRANISEPSVEIRGLYLVINISRCPTNTDLKKVCVNFSEKFTLLREEYSFLKKHYWNKYRYFMEAILYLRILLSHSKNGLLTSFEVISLIEFCFKLSYLSTISSELQIHALGKSTLFSVLTLLYIQDSFPWKSHCLKITKNLISPEPSTSALKL